MDHREKADCIVPFLSVNDTVVYKDDTIERNDVKRIQTPQLSNTESLRAALQSKKLYTDESSAIVANGGTRYFVKGHEDAHKITFISDLKALPCLNKPSSDVLVGNGFDVHAFDEDGEMVLGGVKIDAGFGFKAHSDGDVAIHALIDALLGAAGMGDIGMLFPDTDDTYKNIDSKELLRETVVKIRQFGFEIVNADVTIMAQTPRLDRHKIKMRKTLSALLQIGPSRMNIKATTTEKLGFIGRKEGVGVIATASLKYFDWTK
jgi:2-C-methyl-D-erythritol 4-phosphate cytidylyltransferase/2-C-methyl-D-erythritol 2,4-cyclodiphosphate synthase